VDKPAAVTDAVQWSALLGAHWPKLDHRSPPTRYTCTTNMHQHLNVAQTGTQPAATTWQRARQQGGGHPLLQRLCQRHWQLQLVAGLPALQRGSLAPWLWWHLQGFLLLTQRLHCHPRVPPLQLLQVGSRAPPAAHPLALLQGS
jgi:hypothetical protein